MYSSVNHLRLSQLKIVNKLQYRKKVKMGAFSTEEEKNKAALKTLKHIFK